MKRNNKENKKMSWVGKPSYGGHTLTPESVYQMLFKLAHIHLPSGWRRQEILEEVVQEAWLYLLEHDTLNKVDPTRPLSPFLAPIVKGAIRKVLKSWSCGVASVDAWLEMDDDNQDESPWLMEKISSWEDRERKLWLTEKVLSVLNQIDPRLVQEIFGEEMAFLSKKDRKEALAKAKRVLEGIGLTPEVL